ncbi:MAG: copper amine oxidase N-terminal domain-containing protein [Bacillota bacterium]
MKIEKKGNRRFFIVGIMTTMLMTAFLASLWQLTAMAYDAQVFFDVKVAGNRVFLEGTTDIDNVEVQFEVEDTIYTSNIRDYNHVFTVYLEGATFQATTEEEFKDLVILQTEEPMEVTINEFESDEFTFTISNGIFRKEDVFAVILKSTLEKSYVGSGASFSVESDFFEGGEIDLSLTVAKGFYAKLDEKMVLVPGEKVTLGGDGLQISPIVTGSYVAGTEFKVEISRGFTFVESADIKAKTKGNAVTYGKVSNGDIIVTAPNTDAFSIQGIQIEATTAGVGDTATVRIISEGLVAYASADQKMQATSLAEDTTSFNTTVAEDVEVEVEEVVEEEVVEEEVVEEEVVEEETPAVSSLPKVEITIGATTMAVNGSAVALDVPAYISNGYTMLPLRAVAELMDNATVDWEADTQTAIVNIGNGERVVRMSIGATNYSVNGEQVGYTGATAEITNGRTFVPIRDLMYALGSDDVEWDAVNRVAILNGNV